MNDEKIQIQQLNFNRLYGKKLKQFLSFVVVILITAALLWVMAQMKPSIETIDDVTIIPSVSVIQVEPIDYVVPINSEGMVSAKTSIAFSAEVSGQVVAVSSQFVVGGVFNKGEVLLNIDPRDYELAITKAQANVSAQLANLDLEQAKSDLAKDDWQTYGKKGEPSALNLNLPQVASAKAALAGAKADLLLAQRNLSKASITAPFDGVVLTRNVDIGQFVSIGTVLSNLASSEAAEIRVPLSDQQLIDGGLYGSLSTIDVLIKSAEMPDSQWLGKVAQIEAQRDPQTLMNFVVVSVDQPFAQQDWPLRFNTFVDLEFAGQRLSEVYPLPRHLVTLDHHVHVLDQDSRLQIVPVIVGHADDDRVFITDGLQTTDRIITTQLAGMPAGTKLNIKDQEMDQ